MQRILVLEDDAELRLEICEALEDEGFTVNGFSTVKSFMMQFTRSEPDLVMLDLGLPDGKGSQVIRDLRETSDVGILVLSGRRDEADRIIALEYGADDFVVKPCSPREILARITAILRRMRQEADSQRSSGPQEVQFDGYQLNLAAMELRNPDGEIVALTTAEFQLLNLFVQRPQRVLSREQLTDLLHGDGWSGYDRAIDGLVSRLRKKIPGQCSDTQPLKTVHGAGYMLGARVSLRKDRNRGLRN